MAKPALTFTLEDVLRELGADKQNAEGVTVQAISEKCGMSGEWVRKRIKRALRTGRMEFAGRKQIPGMDNRLYSIPVYRLVQEANE